MAPRVVSKRGTLCLVLAMFVLGGFAVGQAIFAACNLGCTRVLNLDNDNAFAGCFSYSATQAFWIYADPPDGGTLDNGQAGVYVEKSTCAVAGFPDCVFGGGTGPFKCDTCDTDCTTANEQRRLCVTNSSS
jgi:hypothetical protein